MAEPGKLEQDIAEAIRIILEHVGMSADNRRKVRVALGDEPATPYVPPPPPDARDLEIARLQALLTSRQPASADASVVVVTPPPAASPAPQPAQSESPSVAQEGAESLPDAGPNTAPDTDEAAAPAEEPVNPQILPAEPVE